MPVPTLRYTEFVEPPPPPSHTDLCARWLLQFLAAAGEPVKPAHVVRAAAEAGFPRRTLYRARKALAGVVVDLGSSPRDPNKRWTLAAEPSSTLPQEGLPPQEGPPPMEGLPPGEGPPPKEGLPPNEGLPPQECLDTA